MSTSDSCKDGASKSNNDEVCDEVNDMLQNMSTADDSVSVCANCGKEGDDVKNICNKCKMVKYCNAACKKKHRSKHKKQCERRVAELHDVELFKEPPPLDDCPICFLLLPTLNTGRNYNSCCGKVICNGCTYSPVFDDQGNEVDNQKCPYCRAPFPASTEEASEREKIRVEAGDVIAVYNLGCDYSEGKNGFPQDYKKALELWHRAAELGYTKAYCSIGYLFEHGRGVERDRKKAKHYFELAAMKGDADARYNLGITAAKEGNWERALKHFMIAVRCGHDDSLEKIKQLYSVGTATKEEYTKALQSYQAYFGEIKSSQRDKAAAHSDRFRYY